MQTARRVSSGSSTLMVLGLLVMTLMIAGCHTVVSCPNCTPQCSSGGEPSSGEVGDPVNCVPVGVTSNTGDGCTSGQRCSNSTVNQSCPFSKSKTKCRTLPYPGGPSGKCYCTCAQ